jgi:hypothetical protein
MYAISKLKMFSRLSLKADRLCYVFIRCTFLEKQSGTNIRTSGLCVCTRIYTLSLQFEFKSGSECPLRGLLFRSLI